MRCYFHEDSESQPHLFTVDDMDAPRLGDTVWINSAGVEARTSLPEAYRGHKRLRVVQASFSLTILSKYNISAYCEVIVRLDE